jgi:adenylate cyclase
MKTDKHSSLTKPVLRIPDAEVYQSLDKICSSDEFSAKDKTSRLLKFLVDETLAGRGENLKQYTIGTTVFDRLKSFNSELDPVVRIQAGRLRRSLDLYYAHEGKDDVIHIVIPKGSYVPLFLPKLSDALPGDAERETKFDSTDIVRPLIAVLPFQNLTGDQKQDYFVQGFTEELIVELTHFEDFQVISCRGISQPSDAEDSHDVARKMGAHFTIEGSMRKDDKNVKVSIKVLDLKTGGHIWGEHYRRDLTAESLIMIQEHIVREAISNIASEFGIIPQKLSKDARKKRPTDLETYDAVFRFYYYQTQLTPETYMSVFTALEQAVERDPDCGIAAAMLASLYINAYALDSTGSEHALDKARELVQRAVSTDPANQLVRIISASLYFHLDNRELFYLEMENAQKLNPNSSLRIGGIGQFLAFYGDWEQGKILLDKAMSRNISYPHWYHGTTTLYYYRQYEYELAYNEAIQYDLPGLFWGPMLRAACLGQLKRQGEAEQQISRLLKFKPDFQEKSRMLIQRYVKEDALVEHILEGLQKAGLKIQ